MFGWLKRDQPRQPSKRPSLDQNGRAVRPTVPGLFNVEDATVADKRLMISWAAAWTRCEAVLRSETRDVVALFDAHSVGKRLKKADPAMNLIDVAARGLRAAAKDNRARQTAKLLPFSELRLGPQADPCKMARSSAGIIMAERPLIPLPGCDVAECKCWVRQLTKTAAAQGGHSR